MKRIGKRMNNLVYFGTILIIVVSSVLYHLFQKYTPVNVNPAVGLSVTYAAIAIDNLPCLYCNFSNPKPGSPVSLRQLTGQVSV